MDEQSPGFSRSTNFTGSNLCECPECVAGRDKQPPKVTAAMRKKWAAMGIPLVITPKPESRSALTRGDYEAQMRSSRNAGF